MKKTIISMLLLTILACVFSIMSIGCGHTCEFTNKVADNKHLKTESSCSSRAEYYYSCACGNNGEKTFLSGGFKSHVFTYYEFDDNATCTENATETALCDNQCGAKDVKIVLGSIINHKFTNYVSNNDADINIAGTKTATCDYDCGAINTITDVGSKIVKPIYQTDEYIPIIAYSTPSNPNWDGMSGNYDGITYESYKYIKDAGFTGLQPLREGFAKGVTVSDNIVLWHNKAEEDALKAMNICQQLGLTYMVRDWSFYGITKSSIFQNALDSGKTMEQVFEYMFRADNACLSHPNYAGHYMEDEPNVLQIERLVPMIKKYKELVPGKDCFVNLLPMYATDEQLGVNESQGYEYYIDYYCSRIGKDLGYICYDAYPYGRYGVERTYLRNFEIVAERAKANQLDFRMYIQAGGINGTAGDYNGPQYYRHQMYSAMAYGVKYFIYFVYASFSEESNQALIDADGNPTERYYGAQLVNNEIHALEDVFLSFDWQYSMFRNGNDQTPNLEAKLLKNAKTSHPRIASYSVTQDTLTGCFKDGEGRDGFMFVNYADPAKGLNDRITVKFNDARKILVYDKGEEKIIDGNSYNFNLGAGEGRFVIPLI